MSISENKIRAIKGLKVLIRKWVGGEIHLTDAKKFVDFIQANPDNEIMSEKNYIACLAFEKPEPLLRAFYEFYNCKTWEEKNERVRLPHPKIPVIMNYRTLAAIMEKMPEIKLDEQVITFYAMNACQNPAHQGADSLYIETARLPSREEQ